LERPADGKVFPLPFAKGDCLPQRAASRQPQLHRPEAGVLLFQIHML
jgi:hypothetical protein